MSMLPTTGIDAANGRHAAYFVDRILKGAKPADLPVEEPTCFEFIINLKTAQVLGLMILPSVLFQVTEVIRRVGRLAPYDEMCLRNKRFKSVSAISGHSTVHTRNEGRVDGPALRGEDPLDGSQRAKHDTMAHAGEASMAV
jgi:hypothetical protein